MQRTTRMRVLLTLVAVLGGWPVPTPADSYQYDAAGRLVVAEYDSGKRISYTYDSNGNLLERRIETTATVGDGVPANSLVDSWVDFAHTGTELGTQAEPFDTLAEGVTALVNTGAGTLHIVAGSTSAAPTISKPMTIVAEGGVARIGVTP